MCVCVGGGVTHLIVDARDTKETIGKVFDAHIKTSTAVTASNPYQQPHTHTGADGRCNIQKRGPISPRSVIKIIEENTDGERGKGVELGKDPILFILISMASHDGWILSSLDITSLSL